MSEAALYGAVAALNQERCVPPLDDEEVRAICRSIARYEPSAPLLVDPVAAAAAAVSGGALGAEPGEARPRSLAHIEAGEVTLARAFPELRRVVDRVIYEGVTLLAGRPKLGKSWLALTCALAVAGGSPALGGQAVEAGNVLYLARSMAPSCCAGRASGARRSCT